MMYVLRYDKKDWLIILLASAAMIYNNERALRQQRRRDEEVRELSERHYQLSLRGLENQEHPSWLRKDDYEDRDVNVSDK
jgi:hypothetical protein